VERLPIIVIGAGISGLAAAYELHRRGIAARVLEASQRPGGVIHTERFEGWVVDGGPDSMLVQKPAAVALCRELGLGDRLISTLTPRTAYVLRDGRLHPIAEGSFLGFPLRFGALARSSLFSVSGRLRMACELFVPRRDDDEDESIASFVERRFGQEAVDYLAEPLLAGIHAGDVERLSIQTLFPRLTQAERDTGSVIRAFRALRATPSPKGAFVSLPGGVAELVDALVSALPVGTVTTSVPVTALTRDGDSYLVHSPRGVERARQVVLAIPAYAVAALLQDLDPVLASSCAAVPYASTATVAFGYERSQIAHPLRGSGFVVPRVEQTALMAGTWVTSKWPGRAPAGHALLRGFLGGGRDPERLQQSDDALVATAQSELSALLGISGPPLFSRVFRWTRNSPQYEVGHGQRLASIEHRLASHGGLFVTGSGFRAIGIPDCIADGRDTAARAASHSHATAS
jgi:protoporphyrinogen/coproporphyrinogen III oxidase